MARSSLLTVTFLLSFTAALPAYAAVIDDQPAASPVATQAPTPLQEPHAVDQAPLPPIEQARPVKRAEPAPQRRPAAANTSAKVAPRSQTAAKPKAKLAVVQQAARPKPRPAPPQIAAKPAVPAHPQAAVKPATRKLVKAPRPPKRGRHFEYRFAEERPHSGPVYNMPPPVPADRCDETCRYRDWLNRYAAWYRDFGRYYYSAPPRPIAPGRPAPPPMAYSENRAAPPPAYRPDQSERDRLDPWHGYNPYSPANGY